MTLPASAPISLADVATELRAAGGMFLSHDDVKRLLGISRLSGGPITLAQLLGKTRPWWGLVPVKQTTGSTTYYSWLTADGGLAEAVDPYFGNVAITAIQSSLNAAGSGSVLNFASDPGFRNDIKGQLLDSNWGVLREVVFSYNSSTGNWRTPQTTGTDYSTCLFQAAGYWDVNLIKL